MSWNLTRSTHKGWGTRLIVAGDERKSSQRTPGDNGLVAELLKLRSTGRLFLILLLGAMNLSVSRAQSLKPTSTAFSSSSEQAGVGVASFELPDAPGFQASDSVEGSISGTVVDLNGTEVKGAQVILSSAGMAPERTVTTDDAGSFDFADVTPGKYTLAVKSTDFSNWVSKEIVLAPGENYDALQIKLRLSVATSSVDVVYSQYDVAQEQLKAEEKQRVLGVFPNFYVSYVADAAPLTPGQKFRLALRQQIDPVVIAGAAFAAGLETWTGQYKEYGSGPAGFFTRMGAAYGDGFNSSMIAGAILPSLLHQDPRYFYKGTGSKRSRALYAISMVVICKGDNGRWQPNYSNVFGDLAAAGISNAYYPAADRGAALTVVNTSIGFAFSAAGNLFQEFLLKRITPAAQP